MIYKNIILVSPLPPPIGGIASWTERYIKYMKENNINYTLVNSAVNDKRCNDGKIHYFEEIKRAILMKRTLKIESIENKNSIIHYNASCSRNGLIRDYIVLRKIKNRIIYQCHCNLDYAINNKISLHFFKKICGIVDTILVLNSNSKKFASKYHNNVCYIPNFIDPQKNIDSYKVENNLTKICFVGRVERKKGILELIKATYNFPEISFYIIGPLNDMSINLKGYKNIIYMGSKTNDEVMNILKKMDAFILPSYTEGFPLGVLEAMSIGLPIIATNVGSIGDMIGDKGGILINPKNVDDIILAIKKLSDKNVRDKMSKYNKEKVKKYFTIDIVMKQLLLLYNK